MVLKYITAAKEAGFGVVFITHNPHHAHMVGDHFVLLNRGKQKLDCTYDEIDLEHLTQEMAGGDELEALLTRATRRQAHLNTPASSGLSPSTKDLDRQGQQIQEKDNGSQHNHALDKQQALPRRQWWYRSGDQSGDGCGDW